MAKMSTSLTNIIKMTKRKKKKMMKEVLKKKIKKY